MIKSGCFKNTDIVFSNLSHARIASLERSGTIPTTGLDCFTRGNNEGVVHRLLGSHGEAGANKMESVVH